MFIRSIIRISCERISSSFGQKGRGKRCHHVDTVFLKHFEFQTQQHLLLINSRDVRIIRQIKSIPIDPIGDLLHAVDKIL